MKLGIYVAKVRVYLRAKFQPIPLSSLNKILYYDLFRFNPDFWPELHSASRIYELKPEMISYVKYISLVQEVSFLRNILYTHI